MIFTLNDYCLQLEGMLASHDPIQNPEFEMSIETQLTKVATYIQANREEIWAHLLSKKEDRSLFQRIRQLDCKECKISSAVNQLKNIQTACAFLELKMLLEEKDVTAIANWVIQNKEGINPNSNMTPLEVFENLNKGRDLLLQANLLIPDVGNALSYLMAFGLGLKDHKDAKDVKRRLTEVFGSDTKLKVQALGHWINAEKIPLEDACLSLSELQTITSYLHYVDCRELKLDDPEKFISSCSNAYHLFINSKKIKNLKQLPLQLQELQFSFCPLTSLDLSKNLQLQKLSFYQRFPLIIF